ncbi:MAG: alpha-hydroxy acid oxidase [Lysobacterales bacterium]
MAGASTQPKSGPAAKALNIDDLRSIAKRRVPGFIFDYLDGGSDDEYTRQENSRSFAALSLIQRVLVDVEEVDTSTTILGMPTSVPFILSSTGASRFYHSEGELAVARAAARDNVIYGTTSSAMYGLDEVAAVGEAPRFFQVYVFKDREVTRDIVQQCKAHNYNAMFLTVDCATAGNRERDLRNQLSVPPKLTPKSIWQLMKAWPWTLDYLTHPKWGFPNIEKFVDATRMGDFNSAAEWFAGQLDSSFSWDDAAALREDWGGQFVIKGVTSVEDAKLAAEIGATGLVVSNHGGRQLDHAPTTLEVLPDILDAVGDQLEVLVDSGYRRGTDIIKALALGAKGVLLGKAYLYGLAAGGEAGVSRTIDLLRSEIERDMRLMGLNTISDITEDCIRWRDPRFLR